MTTISTGAKGSLDRHGLDPAAAVIWQPSTAQLYEHAIRRGDGRIAHGGPLAVDTGKFTGRSPKDKFIVSEPGSDARIW
ncbi:phosphoenolpyruvate carboxykinase (ATP), partial [Gaiella sp.]|uniref:phosphoenolpyruvate carboxykinase (ATP) n=1 Tax=Gaiella sp. TaxID=2663207 RepID=UPI003267F7AA